MVTDSDSTYHGEHFIMYIIIKSLCCTETNIILYVNYTSIKLKYIYVENTNTGKISSSHREGESPSSTEKHDKDQQEDPDRKA